MITYLEAISQALREEMHRDPDVFLIGEDIGDFGGAFKVTEGFLEEFGVDRVIDTPIAEAGFTGMAVGAAMMGMRPVVEYQFSDFMSCAFDQITNFAAKTHYRFGVPVPVVFRAPTGGGFNGGPFHSGCLESYFVHTAGLKIVAPATVYDAKGLLKAAIRDNNPVLYLEHKHLYRRVKAELNGDDYVVPLDKETVLTSVQKTGKVLIVHEASKTGGFAGELAAVIADEAFEFLDGPIRRVTAPDIPVPFSPPLEDFYLPSADDVAAAARRLLQF